MHVRQILFVVWCCKPVWAHRKVRPKNGQVRLASAQARVAHPKVNLAQCQAGMAPCQACLALGKVRVGSTQPSLGRTQFRVPHAQKRTLSVPVILPQTHRIHPGECFKRHGILLPLISRTWCRTGPWQRNDTTCALLADREGKGTLPTASRAPDCVPPGAVSGLGWPDRPGPP